MFGFVARLSISCIFSAFGRADEWAGEIMYVLYVRDKPIDLSLRAGAALELGHES